MIDCDIKVVGRTRFCVHPNNKTKHISTVGGTKDVKWDKVKSLLPDLIILDKEENTLEMANDCPFPAFILHITSVDNISSELVRLAKHLNSKKLLAVAKRWSVVSAIPPKPSSSVSALPGVISYLDKKSNQDITKIEYMIWKDPWMCIGPNTFIWSVLVKLGLEKYLNHRPNKYPILGDKISSDSSCYYLFSSEPFPFEKHTETLNKIGLKGAIVDGECFSWYGTRSLKKKKKELLN